MKTFLIILATWGGVCLIAWALVHGGARVERRDREIRRIRAMEEAS